MFTATKCRLAREYMGWNHGTLAWNAQVHSSAPATLEDGAEVTPEARTAMARTFHDAGVIFVTVPTDAEDPIAAERTDFTGQLAAFIAAKGQDPRTMKALAEWWASTSHTRPIEF